MIDCNAPTDQDRITNRHRLVAVLLFMCLIGAAVMIGAIDPFESEEAAIEANVTSTEASPPGFEARTQSGDHVVYGMISPKLASGSIQE